MCVRYKVTCVEIPQRAWWPPFYTFLCPNWWQMYCNKAECREGSARSSPLMFSSYEISCSSPRKMRTTAWVPCSLGSVQFLEQALCSHKQQNVVLNIQNCIGMDGTLWLSCSSASSATWFQPSWLFSEGLSAWTQAVLSVDAYRHGSQ